MAKEATNTFKDGMILDVPEILMPSTTYSAALNATLITSDGNEMIMLNEMGNAKIKYDDTYVSLSEGFIPIGCALYGGVLYIASYNPNTEEGELGTYPSPNYSKIYNIDTTTESESDRFYLDSDPENNLATKENRYHALVNFIDGSKAIDSDGNYDIDYRPFRSTFFNFDLLHPVDIKIQPSYDGTVNLILTDYKNIPRMINSGFALRDSELFEVVKHIGDNNTNIYDISSDAQENLFNTITALLKESYTLPRIIYEGLNNAGLLLVGGYVIYIKASDEDGNTTDVLAESGIIPVALGQDGVVLSMNGGYGLLRTDKAIRLTVINIDRAYSHIKVYYSKSTSNIDETALTNCYEIITPYPLQDVTINYKDPTTGLTINSSTWGLTFSINGFENIADISEDSLNTLYITIDKAKTIELTSNILFLGNVISTDDKYYEILKDTSLHIYPTLKELDFKYLLDPTDSTTTFSEINLDTFEGEGYSSSKAVYYYTGYHNEEIYRFGVVYIFSDGSHSKVFNTLGITELKSDTSFNSSELEFLNNPEYGYTVYDTDYIGEVETSSGNITIDSEKWNRRGTCRLKSSNWDPWNIRSISFVVSNLVKSKLKDLGIVGLFFVRQKRIPLKMLLAFTVPIFENTFTPAIKYGPSMYGMANFPPYAAGNTKGPWRDVDPWDYYPTYLVETFYKNVYDKSNRDYDIADEDDSKEYHADSNKELRVYFPKIGDYQNTRGLACKSYWWNLTLDYNKRLLPMVNYGLVHSNKTYNKEDDSKQNSASVNGPYYTYDGKFAKYTGSLPLTLLLEQGAYACFSPEFELNLAYYNNLFTGQDFKIKIIKYDHSDPVKKSILPVLKRSSKSERIYYDLRTNYEVKTNVQTDSEDSNEYFNVKLISVADNVSLLGILRTYNEDNECLDAVNKKGNTDVHEWAYWKYRDTVYFSSKVGDSTDKYRYKEVGGSRVLTFSPCWKYKYGDNTEATFFDNDGNYIKVDDILYYDNDSNGGLSLFEADESSDDASNGGIKIISKDGDDEWFAYPYNLAGAPTNLLRGSYSPYIGLYISNSELEKFVSYTKAERTSEHFTNTLRRLVLENAVINIYIPGFKESNMSTYIRVAMQDKSAYYSICDAINLNDMENNINCYRGDCYASACSHRINRNFQDTTNPSNDTIVQENSFNHYAKNVEIRAMSYYDLTDDDKDDPGNDDNLDKRTLMPVYAAVTHDHSDPINDRKQDNVLKVNLTNLGDLNAIQLGSWINFNLSTTMNIALRGEDRTYPTEKILMGLYRSFYPLYGVNIGGGGKLPDSTAYNQGFSISGGVRKYLNLESEVYITNYFKNRIYYSNVDVTSFYTNGVRTILATHNLEYDNLYGEIVKILDLSTHLLVVMEHGIGTVAVKPLALLNEGSSSTVFINTNNILNDRINVISSNLGSVWKTSIIRGAKGIYGVDTFNKRIWKTDGNTVSIISDGNINSFLNKYLLITDDSIDIGKVCLRTHYNLAKKDIIFTLYKYYDEHKPNSTEEWDDFDNENILWSICYNEEQEKFITFYSWIPEISDNIGNAFLTFDHKKTREINNYSGLNESRLLLTNSKYNLNHYLYKHGQSNIISNAEKITTCKWFDVLYPFEIEVVINEDPDDHKLFENLKLLANKAKPESFHYTITGECFSYAEDKPALYYRQEKAKKLWHLAGSNITYNPNYEDFITKVKLKPLWHYTRDGYKDLDDAIRTTSQDIYFSDNLYVKSLIYCNYYKRNHDPEEIIDTYSIITDIGKDYRYLTGTELIYDETLLEFRIQTHALGVDVNGPGGILRGNMKYLEDNWRVLINPIFYKEKNEDKWPEVTINNLIYNEPPIIFNTDVIPSDIDYDKINQAALQVGITSLLQIDKDDDNSWGTRLAHKLKDKYLKVRVRYSGEDKVILLGIKTIYQISFA